MPCLLLFYNEIYLFIFTNCTIDDSSTSEISNKKKRREQNLLIHGTPVVDVFHIFIYLEH